MWLVDEPLTHPHSDLTYENVPAWRRDAAERCLCVFKPLPNVAVLKFSRRAACGER